jgi:hypothetical protein
MVRTVTSDNDTRPAARPARPPVPNQQRQMRMFAAAYGWRHPHGTLVSANSVSVVDNTIGEAADVRGQRWRPGGDIWLVTSVRRDIGQD